MIYERRAGIDLSMPRKAADLAAWLNDPRTNCGPEVRELILNGTSARTLEKRKHRNVAMPEVSIVTRSASTAIPTHEQLISEMSRIDRALVEEDRATDERNRLRAQQLAAEIRASFDSEEDPDEDEDQDLFFDQCPSCNSSDIEVGFNSDSNEIYTRCAQCNIRASRPALDEAEASAARAKYEQRQSWKGQRGY